LGNDFQDQFMMEANETAGPQHEAEPASGTLDAIIAGAVDSAETRSDRPAPDFSAAAAPSDPEPAPPAVSPAEQPADPAVPNLVPPSRWPEADKAQFASWPRDVQQAVLERHRAMEADYIRKTQDLAETRKAHEPLLAAVTQWSLYLQELNLTPDQAFGEMLNVERTLRHGTPEQKAATLATLAELYVIPLPTLTAGAATADPAVSTLRQQAPGAEPHHHRISEQNEQQHARQRAQAQFNALAQAKDESGNLRYPHFARVSRAMIRLVADDLAASWDEAYAKAVRLDDELHRATVDAERRRVLLAEEARRQEAVEKARRAQPVKTSVASPSGTMRVKGLDAHLDAAMERAGLGTSLVR
jgi:hypothetical protein